MGAGAGQGIEDAYVLSRLLSHAETNIGNIEVCEGVRTYRYVPLTIVIRPFCKNIRAFVSRERRWSGKRVAGLVGCTTTMDRWDLRLRVL